MNACVNFGCADQWTHARRVNIQSGRGAASAQQPVGAPILARAETARLAPGAHMPPPLVRPSSELVSGLAPGLRRLIAAPLDPPPVPPWRLFTAGRAMPTVALMASVPGARGPKTCVPFLACSGEAPRLSSAVANIATSFDPMAFSPALVFSRDAPPGGAPRCE